MADEKNQPDIARALRITYDRINKKFDAELMTASLKIQMISMNIKPQRDLIILAHWVFQDRKQLLQQVVDVLEQLKRAKPDSIQQYEDALAKIHMILLDASYMCIENLPGENKTSAQIMAAFEIELRQILKCDLDAYEDN
jgi:hypothetical protein